jgi:hypothetical protein
MKKLNTYDKDHSNVFDYNHPQIKNNDAAKEALLWAGRKLNPKIDQMSQDEKNKEFAKLSSDPENKDTFERLINERTNQIESSKNRQQEFQIKISNPQVGNSIGSDIMSNARSIGARSLDSKYKDHNLTVQQIMDKEASGKNIRSQTITTTGKGSIGGKYISTLVTEDSKGQISRVNFESTGYDLGKEKQWAQNMEAFSGKAKVYNDPYAGGQTTEFVGRHSAVNTDDGIIASGDLRKSTDGVYHFNLPDASDLRTNPLKEIGGYPVRQDNNGLMIGINGSFHPLRVNEQVGMVNTIVNSDPTFSTSREGEKKRNNVDIQDKDN